MPNLPADIERYHKFVASLPCANCQIQGYSQASHYQGFSGDYLGRGMSSKAHHMMVAPLCTEMGNNCHSLADNYKLGFVEGADRLTNKLSHSEMMLRFIGETIIAGYEAGVIKPGLLAA